MFMTPKMRSRVVVHKKNSSIVSTSLPSDIGGTGPSYKELTLKWKTLVENNVDFYDHYDQFKSIIR